MQGMDIEIDFEVFKALTALRDDERDSYNDVLRRILKLGPAIRPSPPPLQATALPPAGYMAAGRYLPNGTELTAKYKGREFRACVTEGRIVSAGGKVFNSLSRAAKDITDTNVNGLRFWRARISKDGKSVLVSAMPQQSAG